MYLESHTLAANEVIAIIGSGSNQMAHKALARALNWPIEGAWKSFPVMGGLWPAYNPKVYDRLIRKLYGHDLRKVKLRVRIYKSRSHYKRVRYCFDLR